MSCNRIDDKLDDYVDGLLDAGALALLKSHVESCGSCRHTLEREQRLRALLKDYPVPAADADLLDRAIIRASHVGNRRGRWIMTGFGGAIAAGLLAWFIGAGLLQSPEPSDPGVTMALEQPRLINLVFSSATELDDAMLTVILPEGIEIQGYAGQRRITWTTSLKAGRNILPLTLVATSPQGGELLARLEHDDRDRTFRIRVHVT